MLSFGQKGLGISDASFEGFEKVDSVSNIGAWCDCSLIFPQKHNPVEIVTDDSEIGDCPVNLDSSQQAVVLYTQADGKHAMLTQKIPRKLKIGSEYRLSFSTQFLPILNLQREADREYISFANPVNLQVYASTAYCDKNELLCEKTIISNEDWQEFHCEFQAIDRIRYLSISAIYEGDLTYNGHFLLDHLSIEKID